MIIPNPQVQELRFGFLTYPNDSLPGLLIDPDIGVPIDQY